MRKLSSWFIQRAGKGTVLASLIVLALYAGVVMRAAFRAPWIEAGGMPDTNLFYNPAYLYSLAETYGEAGRVAFVRWHFTVDLAFPLIYTAFLVLSLSWLVGKRFVQSSPCRLLNLLPLLGGILDLLENTFISIVMAKYPASMSLLARMAPVMTLAKWVSIYASVLALIVLGLQTLGHRKVNSGEG